jgi:hypothetical protein
MLLAVVLFFWVIQVYDETKSPIKKINEGTRDRRPIEWTEYLCDNPL